MYLSLMHIKNQKNMKSGNLTKVAEFILMGFNISSKLQVALFLLITIIYVLTIFTNVFIIILIRSKPSLHKPMYLFIGTFSFLEFWYPTATVPKFLSILLLGKKTINRTGCIAQLYFHFAMGGTENILLVIMAFDRYVAICNPLRYTTVMRRNLCVNLVLACWVCGFLSFIGIVVQVSNLNFCGPNHIDHYYCDFAPLVILSCSDTNSVETHFFILVTSVILGCFLLVIVSYGCIIFTIMKVSSAKGRIKAFSTCASHFTVIFIFYGTTIFMFVKPPGSHSWSFNKIVSIFPSVVTPLLNPVIYTLRNKEIMDTLRKTAQSK